MGIPPLPPNAITTNEDVTREGRRKITEGIRSTPTPKVDQVVGLNNSTVIYRTIFEPNAKAYGKFNGEFDVLIDKVDRAFDKLKSKGLFQNNIKNLTAPKT